MINVEQYPLSSCDCYNCDLKKIELNNNGNPTNLSVRNCKIPSGFNCENRADFHKDIEPTLQQGIKNINPEAISEKYATNFFHFNCKNNFCCPERQFINSDPRLRSNFSGATLTLNIPPIDGSMKLKDIPVSKLLDNYGQGYKTYSDINAGQILYYTDKSIQEPFFPPNFISPAETTRTLYKDPMDAMKPEYNRVPVTNNNPVGPPRDIFNGDLSFLQDTGGHRADIISKQMGRRNRERWEPRWESFTDEPLIAPQTC